MNSQPTTNYEPASGAVFTFTDPLSPDAVFWDAQVTAALAAPCGQAVTFEAHFNPGMPDVTPTDSFVPGFLAPNSTFTCSNTGGFGLATTFQKSMIAPNTIPYVRGGTNQVHLQQAIGAGCDGVLVEFIDVTFHYYDDLPTITFDLTPSSPEDERKVILRRHRSDSESDYTSSYQRSVPGTDAFKDGKIMFSGTITDPSGAPLANHDVYLRVIDPPDPSPYVPPTESHRNDNPEGYISLFQLPSDPFYRWQIVQSDAAGRFSLPLQVYIWWSGYNAQVEASPLFTPLRVDLKDRCTPQVACHKSAVFTSWRRLYIESDAMLRKGGFVRDHVAAGSTEIPVTKATLGAFQGASAGNPIRAVIVQAPALYLASAYGQFKIEYPNVIGVRKGKKPALLLDQQLANDYALEPASIDPTLPAGAAVGRYASVADLFPRDLDGAMDIFPHTYIEGRVLPDGTKNQVPFVPYIETCENREEYCAEIAHRWFEHRTINRALSNHLHVVTGTRKTPRNRPEVVGDTYLDQYASFAPLCMVWHDAITSAIGGNSPTLSGLPLKEVMEEITAHEVVHSFDVNQPAFGPTGRQGHCPDNTLGWNSGADFCLMSGSRTRPERADGRFPLHVVPWTTSEYRRMRNLPEPLPQHFQPAFNPNY